MNPEKVLSGAADADLRNAAIMLETAMFSVADPVRRQTYGDALELVIDEIHRRIGDVDYVGIDEVYSNPEVRFYTTALFKAHPNFGL